MPKRRLILAILALGIAAALIFAFTRPREPSYSGQPLSVWTVIYADAEQSESDRLHAAEAVRNIGSNAIPFLLDWIDYTPSPTVTKTLETLNRSLDWVNSQVGASHEWALKDRRLQRAHAATHAFAALDGEAKMALPELTRRLNHPGIHGGAGRAARALANMGTLGRPALVAALASTDPSTRGRAAYHIGILGTNARPAVPILIQILKDDDWFACFSASRSLSIPRLEARIVVPALIERLQDSNYVHRITAAMALARYEEDASPAVPVLLKTLNDTNGELRSAVTEALQAIAPEALTNAPPR